MELNSSDPIKFQCRTRDSDDAPMPNFNPSQSSPMIKVVWHILNEEEISQAATSIPSPIQ